MLIVRVCVEAALPPEVLFRLDCVACRDSSEIVRRNLHVQSVSFWAPANIGPYSQAVLVSTQYTIASLKILRFSNDICHA